jgi:hypothetical protein
MLWCSRSCTVNATRSSLAFFLAVPVTNETCGKVVATSSECCVFADGGDALSSLSNEPALILPRKDHQDGAATVTTKNKQQQSPSLVLVLLALAFGACHTCSLVLAQCMDALFLSKDDDACTSSKSTRCRQCSKALLVHQHRLTQIKWRRSTLGLQPIPTQPHSPVQSSPVQSSPPVQSQQMVLSVRI